jgi:selenocysteine lyase/cysteine desulfurase
MSLDLEALRGTPNALAPHYSRFRVSERLLLTGHSHQAWPDVAALGQAEAFDDACGFVDRKWEHAFARAELVREGFRRWLGDPAAEIALGASTHDLMVRLLSALDLRGRPRLVTTDGEFHTLRRQLARLGEEGVEVVRVPARPAGTLASRAAAAVDGRTAAVFVSAVLFETAQLVPDLGVLAQACARHGAELVVDAYHALGVLPMPLATLGLGDAWVTGGGYKYLQLGEGNCFLRLPPHALGLRPVVTGWFAEFTDLAAAPGGAVTYAPGAQGWAGSTYDPTSHYRASRVLEFFATQGLEPAFLRAVSQHQVGLLCAAFDTLDADPSVVARDRSVELRDLGGFLALRSPHAARLQSALADRGVSTDSRGPYLRLGPAPYLSDSQLHSAIAALDEAITALAH